MKQPFEQEDAVDVSKMIKKAKRKTTIRTVSISLVVSLAALFGVMIGNQYLTSSSYERAMHSEQLMSQISGPDQVQTGQVNFSGFLNGTLQTYKAKVIEGVLVPWADQKRNYNVLPLPTFSSMGGSTRQQSVSLPDENMQKQGYEYTRSYNGLSGQREMMFYIPGVNYNGKILNDLPLLSEMDPDKRVEMGISFDKEYSLDEAKQLIPRGLTQTWYWVDTYDNRAFYDPKSDGDGKLSYATPEPENWIKGFGVNASDPVEVGGKQFLDALQQGIHIKGLYHYEFNRIYDYLKKEKKEPQESDIRILGVVVTGTAKQLKSLSGQPYVRGATLGVVVDKY
jgi:hypothetical protein